METMHIRAEPIDERDPVLEFDWNPATGALSGPGAAWVRERIGDALACGEISAHPRPRSIALVDPLHSLTEMAVVVGAEHRLPPELAAYYPPLPEPEPSDIEPLY